jgi:glycosyltransferase involved in cell wall biosynthesis
VFCKGQPNALPVEGSGKQPGKGKYDAVRMGFDMAEGDILMILDADLTVSPEDLPKFYNAIATGSRRFHQWHPTGVCLWRRRPCGF